MSGALAASEEEGISPRLTGLSAFGAKMVSIPTGLAFIVMVTRTLSLSQFGLWEIITTILGFSLYPSTLVNFWATRDTARGDKVGATALVANLILSGGGVGVFLLVSVLSYGQISASLYPLLVGTVLVPIGYWYSTGTSVIYGSRPQKFGQVLVSGELVKLAATYLGLYVFRTGLIGVILALGLSNLSQAVLSTYFVRATLSGGVRLSVARRWLKEGWLPGLNTFAYLLGLADSLAAALAFGATTIVGYYQTAFVVAIIVPSAFFLSYALYPMLLRGASDRLIGTLLDFSLMLGIPMAVGAAVLSSQILFVFSKDYYIVSSLALSILAFSALATALSTFLDTSLMGRENADLAREGRVQGLRRSNLFFVPAVNIGYAVAYVSTVFVFVWAGSARLLATSVLVAGWSSFQLLFTSVIIVIKVRRLGLGRIRGAGRPAGLYAVASLAMAAVVVLASPYFVNYGVDVVEYSFRLFLLVGLGGLVYFGLLMALDGRSRGLILRIPATILSAMGGKPDRSDHPQAGTP